MEETTIINTFVVRKRRYLPCFGQVKVAMELPSLHEESYEITLTVPLTLYYE
jgi:hypothetical protein